MLRLSALATCVVGSVAFKSYVMKVSQVIGGDNSQLLEIDVEAQTERIVNSELTAETDFVKGSVVCGNTWYGIGSSMSAVGNVIAQVDLVTGQLNISKLGGLWYQLKCGEEKNQLYAVSAINSPPQFALVNLTLGGEYPQIDVIGEFPDVLWGGWPSVFTFSGNELQANFPVKGRMESTATGGEMYRMDITSGEITMHKVFDGGFLKSSGVPYFIKHVEGSMTTTGIFAKEELTGDLSLCQVDYSGKKASVSKCKALPSDWWSSGALPLECSDDGLHYFPSIGGRTESYEPINAGSMLTGDVKEAYELKGEFLGEEPDYYIGTHVCIQEQMTV